MQRVRILLKLTGMHGKKCWYCQIPFTSFKEVELDHIVPASRGGATTITNLAIACKPCNRAKGNMELSDFLKWMRRPKKPLEHIHDRAKQSEQHWRDYGEAIEKGLRKP